MPQIIKLRSGYATVDPYGFNTAAGAQDVLANANGTPSVCLWVSGCTNP